MERRETDGDREVAALLSAMAFVEIRYLAGKARRMPEDQPIDDVLKRIRFLADLCHNLPGVSRPRRWRPSRRGDYRNSRERAMSRRPMSYTWNTAGSEGQAWMLRHIEDYGLRWTPPPPLPLRPQRIAPPLLMLRQKIGVFLGRWPVRAPAGRPQLPREAHVLKALDTDTICALYEEAGRLRLGLGSGTPWLRGHLDPDGVHYLVPDPADFYWPGNPNGRGHEIRWWQCTALLRMYDGAQVRSTVAVLPETFAALSSTLPRRAQSRLVHLARAAERDTHLWGLDHEAECDPAICGYVRETTDGPHAPQA
jgi:hypothetical protein